MQHLGTPAFERAAGGHLLGRKVSPGLESCVGQVILIFSKKTCYYSSGLPGVPFTVSFLQLKAMPFAVMDDQPLWKLVSWRGCTHLSVPKSHLLLLQVTFLWDVTCPVLMDVSFAFLLPSRAFRKLGPWPEKVRSDQTPWCPCTTRIPSHVICCPFSGKEGTPHRVPCACWCWVSHGTHLGRPRAAAEPQSGGRPERRRLAEVGQVLPQEGAGSSWPVCRKLEGFKLSSCHCSQVCIISVLLLPASLSLAVLVVPVALLLLLALVFYFLSVLGAACFLSGFLQI